MKKPWVVWGGVVLFAVILAACLGAPRTPVPTTPLTLPVTASAPALPAPGGGEVTPLFPAETPLPPAPSPTEELAGPSPYPAPGEQLTQAALATKALVSSPTTAPAQPSPTATHSGSEAYPPPGSESSTQPAQTPAGEAAYPPPGATTVPYPPPVATFNPYPGPGQATQPQPTSARPTATPQNIQVTSTAAGAAGGGSATAPAATPGVPTESGPTSVPTPTEFLPVPRLTGVAAPSGTITIWHSWAESEVKVLMQIIQAYQTVYPDVRFDLLYVPQDDLLGKYEEASYNGGGPSLLFGPAEWGAYLYDRQVVENLAPYASDRFLATINPAALGTARYQGALISLPYAMRGMVLYRNKSLVGTASTTMDELISSAQSVKQNGVVGAYFDQGPLFSLAHLMGLGGQVAGEKGQPVFDQNGYQKALEWLKLLDVYQQAGPVELNGSRHTQLFQEGRVGLMIEGTWSRGALAKAIGYENLVIDPWPSYGSGHLSGFVWADSLYLNANTVEISPLDQLAALRFMGYLMTSEVQSYLGELGFVPSVKSARPNQDLTLQAMQALQGGTAFPPVLQGEIKTAYLDIFQSALYNVFTQKMDPLQSLQSAYQSIQERLLEVQP